MENYPRLISLTLSYLKHSKNVWDMLYHEQCSTDLNLDARDAFAGFQHFISLFIFLSSSILMGSSSHKSICMTNRLLHGTASNCNKDKIEYKLMWVHLHVFVFFFFFFYKWKHIS